MEDKLKLVFYELKSLLGLIGASYNELAEILGEDKSYVSKVLSGQISIRLETFIKICKSLQILNHSYNNAISDENLTPWAILKKVLKK